MSNLCRPRRSGNCASLSPPQPQDEAVALLREVIERDGAGEIMDCCDDMCIGSGSCIHGSMRICPACRGSGESWTSGKEETK